jgi:hypothetical protein
MEDQRMNTNWKTFFLIAALYDGLLGLAFFFLYNPLFSMFDITLPNNTSYIHLTAAFVFVQGVGYWFVFQDPEGNHGIVKLGIVYKGVFALLAAYYWAIGQLLHPIFALFGILDVLFLIGFVLFLMSSQGRSLPVRG